MYINWKKSIIITLDIAIAAYLCLAVSQFNKPDSEAMMCTKVGIDIDGNATDGFLSGKEIKKILEQKKVYPLNKRFDEIDVRQIEEILRESPFVESAECYKTRNGNVTISLQQRMPIIRIKSASGADYYVDNRGGIMPNTKYVADLIIATGDIPKWYAQKVLHRIANFINDNEFWKNEVVQLNILPDRTIEMVPRVGDHIVYLGDANDIENKFERLRKFYKYGLTQAGWNKYHYISVEFSNQIICKKNKNI